MTSDQDVTAQAEPEQQQRHVLWQRLPYGWIEFASFGQETPAQWLQRYLSAGDGWLPEEARDAISRGFQAGVALFARTGFDSAGVSILGGESPAVRLLCTNVVLGRAEDAVSLHRLLPLGRFGAESTAETFTAPDGRVGTVSFGTVTEAGMSVAVTVGEIRLPDDAGSVVVMGVSTDAQQRHDLGVLTAFVLSMTQYLPEGQEPRLPDGVEAVPPEELGRRLLAAMADTRSGE